MLVIAKYKYSVADPTYYEKFLCQEKQITHFGNRQLEAKTALTNSERFANINALS